MAPYQERPQALPLPFKVRFDPSRDQHRYFPLIAELSRSDEKNSAAAVAVLASRLAATENALPEIYAQTRAYYDHFQDSRLSVRTPDSNFDAAIQWAEIAIDHAKVRTGDETSLVAGWYPSFDSARPGFGWYFGRDTLWTLYAVNSYGDKALAKEALEHSLKTPADRQVNRCMSTLSRQIFCTAISIGPRLVTNMPRLTRLPLYHHVAA